MQNVLINRQPVELFKLLKFEGLVASGGEAKYVISQGLVKLNGEIETRKRKQIMGGDTIEFNQQKLFVLLAPGQQA